MKSKISTRRKVKTVPKRTRLREINLFQKKEKELYEDVPQHFLGISDQQLGRLFENAWALIEIHEAGEAVKGFRLLCHLHPYVSDFWYGLAHSLKESGNYEEALKAYLMAETMEPSRFEYYKEAVESALELKKKKEAKRIFQRLIARKRTIGDYNERKSEIKNLEEAIASEVL